MNQETPIQPYSGAVVPSRENFAAAFPQVAAALSGATKGVQNLSEESLKRRKEMFDRMRAAPPAAATIVNLHPWAMSFPASMPLMSGIVIPPCAPGEPFAHQFIRKWRYFHEADQDNVISFTVITPMELARQCLNQFCNQDNEGGGLLIYAGEINPNKAGEVDCYNSDGMLLTEPGIGYDYDDQERKIQVPIEKPIRRQFSELLMESRDQRNAIYSQRVLAIDSEFRSPELRRKVQITEKHFKMADVLVAEGILPKMPEWRIMTRLELGMGSAVNDCPQCKQAIGGGETTGVCSNCGHILDALKAYQNYKIPFTHIAMESLEQEQWGVAEKERVRRESNKRAGQKFSKEKGPAEAAE